MRLQFYRSKKLECALKEVKNESEIVDKMLEIMLPASVIPRLKASNYQFSSITDRFDFVFCLFLDFFESQTIKKLETEMASEALHHTFTHLDEILLEWPSIEKIKVCREHNISHKLSSLLTTLLFLYI
jgi:hypothetical protein